MPDPESKKLMVMMISRKRLRIRRLPSPKIGMMRTMVNGSHQWWTTQFKGTWKPKMVDNPEYKGKWEHR
jgi:hypothetical protein